METALRVIGAFFVGDLIALVLFLVVFTIISGRGQTKARLRCSFGILLFSAVCLALIYAGLWIMCLAAGKQ